MYLSGKIASDPILNQLTAFTCLHTLILVALGDVLRLPGNLSQCTSLQSLKLLNVDFNKFPGLMNRLTLLTSLEIGSCSQFRQRVPTAICSLTTLRSLTFSNLTSVQLPVCLSRLTLLTSFEVIHCSQITELPHNLGQLVSLEHLALKRMRSLQELPQSFSMLHSLTSLQLIFCEELSLQGHFCLPSLQELELFGLGITRLPNEFTSLTNLTRLHVLGCMSLRELRLTELQHRNLTPECRLLLDSHIQVVTVNEMDAGVAQNNG